MPKLKACRWPGCPRASTEAYCQQHRKNVNRERYKQMDSKRGSSTARGYGSDWQKMRALYMAHHPYCELCEERGIVRAGHDIDHKIPHKGNDTLRLDVNNLQTLCKECHGQKSAREARQ